MYNKLLIIYGCFLYKVLLRSKDMDEKFLDIKERVEKQYIGTDK